MRPICEYLDVAGTSLLITVRLRGEDRPHGERHELRLTDRRGRTLARATAEVTPRVDTVGRWTRSALRFEVATEGLPEGSFRLLLAGPSDVQPSATGPTRVEPSTGLLASSRPRRLGERWVQPLPAAGRPSVWLRLDRDSRRGRLRRLATDLGRDLAFAAHLRRFTWVRAARLLTRPLAPRGPVWLVGERPETARDNGRAFFEHLRATRPDAAVYYVITADSPMRAVVEPLGNVVTHSSWRHRLLMLHADVLANAYSIKHMLPTRWHPGAYMRQGAWRTGAYRVYLKHGVHLSPYAVKRANGGYDLIAAVGEKEAEALTATSGYTDQVVVTGLARYDALVRPPSPSRTVLFMPTWRRYLVPTLFGGDDRSLVAYEGSAYQRFIDSFLGSRRLAEVLEKHDLTLAVVPHYNLGAVLRTENLASERIRLLDAATADIPGLLRSCDLLVTDYSSVQFDVAYLGTPVVYCPFDEEEYVAGHSAFSWFRVERDGFGPVARDAAATVEAIERYAGTGFAREPEYEERVGSVFAHRDKLSCARLTDEVDELLRERRGEGPATSRAPALPAASDAGERRAP